MNIGFLDVPAAAVTITVSRVSAQDASAYRDLKKSYAYVYPVCDGRMVVSREYSFDIRHGRKQPDENFLISN